MQMNQVYQKQEYIQCLTTLVRRLDERLRISGRYKLGNSARCFRKGEVIHYTPTLTLMSDAAFVAKLFIPSSDDDGGPRRPNCCQNGRRTVTTLIILEKSNKHQLHSVGIAAILSNNYVCYSREMASVTLRPFKRFVRCDVCDTNFNIIAHLQLKI
jgi:hypothetical protein